MKITCYIVDDEYHAIETLKALISKTPELELTGFSDHPVIALNELQYQRPDLIFLDIEMPEISGLEFADFVSAGSLVIFTTAYPDHALTAFDKQAFDYLVKPILFERFYRSIHRVKRNFPLRERQQREQRVFFIKTSLRGKLDKIQIDDINYVEADGNYVHFHLKTGKKMAYQTISEVAGYLSGQHFTRIHKSYLVHHAAIKSWEPGRMRLASEVDLPIGRTYQDHVQQQLGPLIFKSAR